MSEHENEPRVRAATRLGAIVPGLRLLSLVSENDDGSPKVAVVVDADEAFVAVRYEGNESVWHVDRGSFWSQFETMPDGSRETAVLEREVGS